MSRQVGRAVALAGATVLFAACGGGSSGPAGPSGPPVLTLINGALEPSGPANSTVLLQGSNFGNTQGAGRVLFAATGGGVDTAVIASSSDWSNTVIVTTVPGTAVTGPVRVVTTGGTSDSITFTLTQNAAFSPSTIAWTQTTALPVGLGGHAAAFGSVGASKPVDVVYVVGGADSTYAPRNTVYYSLVDSTGKLGAWTAAAHPLPAQRAFAAAVVATGFNSAVTGPGYLYVLGGDSTAAGAPVATVHKGTLDSTGAITGWSTATDLPQPLHSLRAVIFNGNLYVAGGSTTITAGGSTTNNVPVATVYRAPLDASGNLGAWVTLTALPFARSHFALGNFGLYLYAFGGDSATVTPNDSSLAKSSRVADIAYAKIDIRTGNLVAGGWTKNAGSLIKAVGSHTAVVAGGYVLVTAGLYGTPTITGATEESYAAFNPDGSVGSVNGATGSHTIQSNEPLVSLFDHAELSVVDRAGTAHVLVLGGDNAQAPGKMRKEVWIY